MQLSPDNAARFARNLPLPGFGPAGQQRLLDAGVLVVGAGGLGGPALLYLAAAGVGRLGVADPDAVELSNLQRQILHTRADVGRGKTGSAARALHRLWPEARVEEHPFRVNDRNGPALIRDYDVIVDGTDTFAAKFLLADICAAEHKPLIHGGVLGMTGQAATLLPHSGPCLRCIFPHPPPECAALSPEACGVFGPAAGVIGAVQAAEAVKCLLGTGDTLCGRMFILDALTMSCRVVDLPDADCPHRAPSPLHGEPIS